MSTLHIFLFCAIAFIIGAASGLFIASLCMAARQADADLLYEALAKTRKEEIL